MMPYNVLNYPAGILPMTRVTSQDVQDMAQYPTKDAKHRRVKEVYYRLLLISYGNYSFLRRLQSTYK